MEARAFASTSAFDHVAKTVAAPVVCAFCGVGLDAMCVSTEPDTVEIATAVCEHGKRRIQCVDCKACSLARALAALSLACVHSLFLPFLSLYLSVSDMDA